MLPTCQFFCSDRKCLASVQMAQLLKLCGTRSTEMTHQKCFNELKKTLMLQIFRLSNFPERNTEVWLEGKDKHYNQSFHNDSSQCVASWHPITWSQNTGLLLTVIPQESILRQFGFLCTNDFDRWCALYTIEKKVYICGWHNNKSIRETHWSSSERWTELHLRFSFERKINI